DQGVAVRAHRRLRCGLLVSCIYGVIYGPPDYYARGLMDTTTTKETDGARRRCRNGEGGRSVASRRHQAIPPEPVAFPIISRRREIPCPIDASTASLNP